VPFIKLLIINPFKESLIDIAALKLCGIEVVFVESNQLMAMTSIDFDTVLLDDNPNQDILTIINHLQSIAPNSKIIVTLRHSSAKAVYYLQVGVTGLLDSLDTSERLAKIIHLVFRGEYFLYKNIAQLLAMRQIKKLLTPFAALSSREFDVFCLLAEGCSLKTISEQLGINSKTVSNCQTLIKLKLKLDNKQAIKKMAKTHGLIMHKSV
jgi:DNA-binding NarL/FixJ family response regulator